MAPRARHSDATDTQAQILDVAERLVQTRGFNAFSYADVATELGISKPALHYHFSGKSELGQALLARYSSRFEAALIAISEEGHGAPGKLAAYANLYAQVLVQQRMCLCGMLAADYHTLPEPMRAAVVRFFDSNETWLAAVLDEGQRDGTLRFTGSSSDVARMIIDTLEGAMLVARTYGDNDASRFSATARRLIGEFTT
jgi:TetR/AcrR family transcriptional repressor of nem operon